MLLFKYSFLVSFWLCWVFVAAGSSQVAVSRGDSAVPAPRPLTAEQGSRERASAAVARELGSCGFRALEHTTGVEAQGFSCSRTCGVFPDQGPNP